MNKYIYLVLAFLMAPMALEAGTVGLSVGNSASLDVNKDQPLYDYLTGTMGLTVRVYDDGTTTYDPTSFDCMIVSESVNSGNVAWLKSEAVGLLTLEGSNWDEFDLGSSGDSDGPGDADVTINNNTHFITRLQSTGALTIGTSDNNLGFMGGPSNDVVDLAQSADTAAEKWLVYCESGDTLVDSTTAAGRRVFIGGQYWNNLNATGKTLVERCVAWVADYPMTISGTALASDESTALANGKTVRIRVNGEDRGSTTTSGGTGAWSFTGNNKIFAYAGDTITIHLEGETETANTILITDGLTDITGLKLMDDHVVIRSDNGATATTIVDLTDYDNDQNVADMLFDAEDAATDTLSLEAGVELHIESGELFTPGGNVDVDTGGIDIRGTWTATGSETINNAGNWNNAGTFTAASSTVVFDGADQSISGSTTFNNFTKTDPSNDSTDVTLTFSTSGTTTISGAWTLTGIDADDRVNLVSATPATRWTVNGNGTFSITWVEVTDSDANGGSTITHTNASNGGNNINWGFPGSITVSGTLYQSDETTARTGTSLSIAIRVNGASESTTTTNSGDGTWSFAGVSCFTGDTITVFIKGETQKANWISITDSLTDITGIGLFEDHVVIQADSGSNAIDIVDLTDYDNDQNATDMLFDAEDAATDTLSVEDGNELYIVAGDTFTPGGNVDVGTGGIDIRGTWTAAGSETVNTAGSWNNSGTFTAASGTVEFDGSAMTISGTTTFNNFTVTDGSNDSTDVTLTFTDGVTQTVSGTLTITGTDADDRVNLVSSSPGNQWGFTSTGSTSIDFFEVTDSDASGGNQINFTNGVDGGNNLNWGFPATITVSGTAYDTDGTTPLTGSTRTVALRLDGGSSTTVETNSGDGTWSTTVSAVTGQTLTIYLESETEKSNAVTIVESTTNVTGVALVENRILIRADNGSNAINIEDLIDYDNDQNATDMLFDAEDASPDTLSVEDGVVLVVASGDTFTPAGNVDVGDGGIEINGTWTAAAGETINVEGSWNNQGTFTQSTSTVVFDGILHNITGDTTFYNVTMSDGTNDESDVVVSFDNTSTTTISGLWTITGTDATDRVNLRSDDDDVQWSLAALGTFSIDFADVQDSDNSAGNVITHTNTSDQGNNVKWFVTIPSIAFIVGDSGTLSGTSDTPIKNYLENELGYTVTVKDDGDSSYDPTTFSAVVISESINSGSAAWLKNEVVGILTLEGANNDEFELGSGGSSDGPGDADCDVDDGDHFITSRLEQGSSYVIGTTDSNLGWISGTANDVKTLMSSTDTGTEGWLVAVESGGTLQGGTNTAAARRAYLGAFHWSSLNWRGRVLFNRALDYVLSTSVDVSGTAYDNQGSALTGTTRTVGIRVNGVDLATVETSAADGTFSFSNVNVSTGDSVCLYFSGETETGNTVTITDAIVDISGLRLMDDHVILRSDNGSNAITIADLVFYDNDDNATDLLFDAEDAATDTLVVETGVTLLVENGEPFAPGGDVTVETGGIKVQGTWTASAGEEIECAGDFNASSGTFTASTSVITLDGTTQQTVAGGTTFSSLHYAGTSAVSFAGTATINTRLVAETWAVTFAGVTVSFANGAEFLVGTGNATGTRAVVSLDGAVLTSTSPGTNRWSFAIEPGGDIHAAQNSQINSLVNGGMVFRSGSRMGSNTTGSNGYTGFSFVTFANVAAGGTALDLSELAGGDAEAFPDSLREIRFNGSGLGYNVEAGASTPTMKFHVQTGDFGSVAADGESRDNDASDRIDWHDVSTYAALVDLRARGRDDGGNGLDITWRTSVEVDNEGFHVYRASERHGEYSRVNTDLIPSQASGDGMSGSDYLFEDPTPERGTVVYYKVEDVDGQGRRTLHGPVASDWDRDGMADDWEIANGFDHLDASDASGDADGDGLSNLDEYRFGQDPRNSDTDGDGIPDGQESLTEWDGPLTEGIIAGDGLRVIGQDPLGITLELEVDGVSLENVNRQLVGWAGATGLWHHRFKPSMLTRVSLIGQSAESSRVEGWPRLPLRRAVVHLPEDRIPRVRVLSMQWGDDVVADHPIEPVPRVEDRPSLVEKRITTVKTVKSLKKVKKILSVGNGYETKVRRWASLFMSRRQFEKSFLEEVREVTETVPVIETVEEEVIVLEPSTRLVDVHALDPAVYPAASLTASPPDTGEGSVPWSGTAVALDDGSSLEGPQRVARPAVWVDSRSSFGEKDVAVLNVKPVGVDTGTGRVRHLKRVRFRIDYIWKPAAETDTTDHWREIYEDINETKPAWLDFESVAEITLNSGAAGLFRLSVADLAGAGMDTTALQAEPSRLRLFQGSVELSVREIAGAWLFFADPSVTDTLFNNRLILHAVDDPAQSGRRWSDVASLPGFASQVTGFRQAVRFETNNAFSPIYMERTPDTVFVNASSMYKTQERTFPIDLPGLSTAGDVTLRVRMWAAHDYDPHIDQGAEIRLNGQATPIGLVEWPGRTFVTKELSHPAAAFAVGSNQIRIKGVLPAGLPKSRIRLDWIEAVYPRSLAAQSDQLLMSVDLDGDGSRVEVSGFSDPSDVTVLDVSDASAVRRITGAALGAGTVAVNVGPGAVVDTVGYPNFLRPDSDRGPRDPNGRSGFGFGFQTGSPTAWSALSAGISRSQWTGEPGGDASCWPLGDRISYPAGDGNDRLALTGLGPQSGSLVHRGSRLLFVRESDARSVDGVVVRDLSGDVPVRGRTSAVDHLIVVDESLLDEAVRLADHLADREIASTVPLGSNEIASAAGRSQIVELVTYQQLCREYAHGLYTTAAIDLYVKERYRTAAVWNGSVHVGKPKFLTIIGSGNWNSKGVWNFPGEKALIPSVVVRGGVKASASDWAFALVSDDELPDLAVGRLDCGTPAELVAIVDKVIDYDGRLAQETPRAVLVGDDEPELVNDVFVETLEEIRARLESPWIHGTLYRTELSAAAISQGILDALNLENTSMLIYNGHGNFTAWGGESFVTPGTLGSLQAGHWLPLIIEGNCLSADWFHISPRSLGTQWHQKTNGGAIGVIGTTSRTSEADKADILVHLVDNLVRRGHDRFGEALRRAKLEARLEDPDDSRRAIITQHLLGVPSQMLK